MSRNAVHCTLVAELEVSAKNTQPSRLLGFHAGFVVLDVTSHKSTQTAWAQLVACGAEKETALVRSEKMVR